jgi:hypothetical protein
MALEILQRDADKRRGADHCDVLGELEPRGGTLAQSGGDDLDRGCKCQRIRCCLIGARVRLSSNEVSLSVSRGTMRSTTVHDASDKWYDALQQRDRSSHRRDACHATTCTIPH